MKFVLLSYEYGICFVDASYTKNTILPGCASCSALLSQIRIRVRIILPDPNPHSGSNPSYSFPYRLGVRQIKIVS
jgi:hypothetical protein